MSEQLKKADLIQGDPFLEIKKTIDEALTSLNAYDNELKSVAKSFETVSKSAKSTSSDLTKLVEIEKKSSAIVKEAQNTKKEQLRLEKELEKARLSELRLQEQREKAFDKYEAQQKKLAIQAEKEKKRIDDQNNAYKQLSSNTQKLKDESKRLGAELLQLERSGDKNTKAFKDLEQQYNEVTRAAQQGDAQLKKLDATVGDNQRKVGLYENALNGLKGAIGTLGLALGAGALVGGTKQLLTDINQLNLEASRLGISAENISAFASSASALSGTFGTDARENMIAANALMKEFNLTQQEAFDLMEQGYLSGANSQGDMLASVREYSAQVKASGGDANTLFNILSRAGKEGIYSDKGIDVVKEFGLRIREQTTSTSDAMKKAFGDEFTNQIFGSINDGSMTSVQALELVAEKMKDTTIPTNQLQTVIADLFGGAGEDAGLRFIQTLTDITDETGNLVDVTDPYIQQQMEVQALNERLAASQQKLYESLGGSGATLDSLILKFKVLFFENIMPAVGLVMKLVAAFGIYNGVILASKARHLLLNGELKKTFTGLTDVFKASKTTSTGVNDAGKSIKGMGNALKSIVWVAIIGAVIELATAFYDVASGAKAAREQAALTDAYVEKSAKKAEARITERTTAYEKEIKALDAKRQKDLAAAKTDEQRAKIEAEFLKTKQALTKGTEAQVRTDIRAVNQRRDAYQQDLKRLELLKNEFELERDGVKQTAKFNLLQKEAQKISEKYNLGKEEATLFGIGIGSESDNSFDRVMKGLNSRVSASNKLLKEYNSEWDGVKSSVFDATTELEVNEIAIENNADKISAKIPDMKSLNTEFQKQNEYISRQSELLKEIASIESDMQVSQKEKQLEDLMIDENATIEQARVIVDEINQIKTDALNAQYAYELEQLQAKAAQELEIERQSIEQKRAELLAQDGLTKDARAKIEANYQTELDAIAEREKQRAQDLATEKELIELKRVQELNGIEEERAEKLNTINDEILSKQKDAVKGVNDDIRDDTVELLDMVSRAQDELAKIYENSVERKIEAAKKEEELADEQLNRLQELADNGAILDEQSIKDAEQRKRDAVKEQLRLAKQQERAQFIQSALANITNQLKNGKSTGEAVSSTVALQEVLKGLFSGFSGFYKGTNSAPEGFAWVDEKGSEIHTDKHGNIKDFGQDGGARLKYLEKGDKIIPHQKSMDLLNTTLPNVKDRINNQIDPNTELLREQNRLLKNAVDSKITAEEIGRIIHVTTEDKKGNLSRINRYKYHR